MNFEENLAEQLQLLPDYLAHHILLTASALLIGIAICLPLAFLVVRVKPLQWPVLSFASVMQTIPGIALLALMVAALGQIGFTPALIALVLYSMLPILRNAVTGLTGVDASILEAATGCGMTRGQTLFHVQLPLAIPVIIAGIRTSAVWIVGTATLSTPVGATSLGNFIFSGLQTQNSVAVIVGCVSAAGLAILLDQAIRLLEIAWKRRNRVLRTIVAIAVVAGTGVGMSPLLLRQPASETGSIIVGAKTFTEQYILAEVIKRTVEGEGIPATTRTGMGSTVLFEALASGSIDCYVDYSGTLWANILKRGTTAPGQTMLREISEWLKEQHDIHLVGALGFENTYALAMPRERAARLGAATIGDLSRHAPGLRMGSDYEFYGRPEWKGLRDRYGLAFHELRTFDPTLMYAAVQAGEVDVISAYSTDGRILLYDLRVLEDPLGALPPYDAVILLSGKAARRRDLVQSLGGLIGLMSDDAVRRANKMVDIDGASIEKAADFLLSEISVKGRQD
jgi:osmoprotectant transport system permease protein